MDLLVKMAQNPREIQRMKESSKWAKSMILTIILEFRVGGPNPNSFGFGKKDPSPIVSSFLL